MVAAGVMEEDERVELIGGELVPMSPKGNHHEVVKVALPRRWYRIAPDDLDLAPETTFRLSEDTYLEPDVVIYPRASRPPGPDARQRAAGRGNCGFVSALRHGSQGQPLCELRHPRTLGHRRGLADRAHLPRSCAGGYSEARRLSAGDRIVPLFAPDAFALRLDELELA